MVCARIVPSLYLLSCTWPKRRKDTQQPFCKTHNKNPNYQCFIDANMHY